MLLTGPSIVDAINTGRIVIDPLPKTVNPNSVNLTLGPVLKVYEAQMRWLRELEKDKKTAEWTSDVLDRELYHQGATHVFPGSWVHEQFVLDPYRKNPTIQLVIPEAGSTLLPGILYLGATVEAAGSDEYAPMLEGRSTWARLGFQSHQTAGFGDVGFKRQWTLEIAVMSPTRVRPGDEICQVAFQTVSGHKQLYDGEYGTQSGPTPAKVLVKN